MSLFGFIKNINNKNTHPIFKCIYSNNKIYSIFKNIQIYS